MIYPEPEKGGRGKKGATGNLLETGKFSRQRLDVARIVLRLATLEPFYAAEAKERQQSGKSEDGAAGGRGRKKTLVKKLTKVNEQKVARNRRRADAGRRQSQTLKKL